jgi:ADP-ribose pyrophosphatase
MAEVLAEGRYVRLVREGTWEWAERVAATGAVLIAATTEAGEVVLVEQHRVPMGARVIELPAGLVGDHTRGESTAEAAARELEEETGFRAGHLEEVTGGPISSGMTNETAALFRATGLVRVGDGGGDDSEDITVHLVPLAEVHPWLVARAAEGVLVDPKVYAGLWFLTRG